MEQSNSPAVVTPQLAVQTYLLDRMSKHIKGALEARKEQIKAIVGPSNKVEVEELKFTVSAPQSRDTFNEEKAITALGGSKYSKIELIISAKVPVAEIPPAVLETLSQYFEVERRAVVTQGDADLAILNGDCKKEAVYDKGKEFCSLTLGSKKVTNDQIAAMYREICPDVSVLALAAPDATEEE
jgi:hypothetical protein